MVRLGAALLNATPPGHHIIASAGIVMGRSYLITDVTVVASRVLDAEDSQVSPRDVLLAVEIESPSSITTDRITKPATYAAAGIPYFWRVETEPLTLVAYRLDGDVYAEAGSWGADQVARIGESFDVDIAVGSLLPS